MIPVDPCDFHGFDDAVREARDYFERYQDPGPLRDLFDGDVHSGLLEASINITADQFLRLARVEDGITLVKSPKGTGKTECLRHILANDQSVLLVGHRKSLISQSCNRLRLDCYLDIDGPLAGHSRLGICLDSLQRLQNGDEGLSTFRTIVIDESEQVLAHFLSDTMSSEDRSPGAIFTVFRALLQRARRVIALDADLGWLTFETLTGLAVDAPVKKKKPRRRRTHIHLNDRPTRGLVEVFRFDRQLQADLKHSLADGKRVFVASNGKGYLDRLDAAIAREFDGRIRVLKVTRDTTASPEVRAFIEKPDERALDYDLILASPSMGTGVDITFSGGVSMVDVVYGFFDAEITTHHEMDQQLARVRHPGAVKVWITPRLFRHDTARDVVRGELLRSHLFSHLLIDFDENGRPVYREDDPFLAMAMLVRSQANASKNALKGNFLTLKERQGHAVTVAAEDEVLRLEGINLSRAGKRLAAARRVEAVLAAAPLRRAEFDHVAARLEWGGKVAEVEMWSMVRTAIELFYREPITDSLVALDDDGRYRSRVKHFTSVGLALDDDSVRYALELVAAEALPARLRFVRSPRDVAAAIVYLLHRTPLMAKGALRTGVMLTKDDLGEFVDALLANRAIVENALDLDVRADVREKPMTSLNAILRMIGLRMKLTRRRRVNGRIVCEYQFDRGAYDRMLRIIERRRTHDGWRTLYGIHGWSTEELDETPEERGEDEPAPERRRASRLSREKARGWRDRPSHSVERSQRRSVSDWIDDDSATAATASAP
jgi:Origin of replication binding protein